MIPLSTVVGNPGVSPLSGLSHIEMDPLPIYEPITVIPKWDFPPSS